MIDESNVAFQRGALGGPVTVNNLKQRVGVDAIRPGALDGVDDGDR